MAVDVLMSRGVPENRILFLNLIASPEGIETFAKKFPKVRVVTAFVDQVRCSPKPNEVIPANVEIGT
jgi:uracil phosphoribosyltransferase